MREWTLKVGIFHIVVAMGIVMAAGSANAVDQKPEAFIEELTILAINDLTDATIPRDVRLERLQTMMAEKFAGKSIATWVLGRHLKRASESQRERYMTTYARLMTESYVDRFTRYNGESLEIVRAEQISDTESVVKTIMQRPGGFESVKIDWRLRDHEGKWLVLDILVEGVSMAQAQRSEFASTMRRLGGDMDAFLDELEQRALQVAARSD